jgi:hypothetical protein
MKIISDGQNCGILLFKQFSQDIIFEFCFGPNKRTNDKKLNYIKKVEEKLIHVIMNYVIVDSADFCSKKVIGSCRCCS